ncbi:hypothetical protein HETIRDRAFT_480729 [Heterobasidion irregulare TC 32-1]|uniref:Uncharacterized protein n=1 Tax=Heterobasidion irregulare (strain TC 32-1) TaxID=747525 RepID=W4JUL8_HETIT|nr:uncharacterized protein HETIRDRAFT_480729 [Heterobasidion irregulare TC 32-1]ETW76581.1 hypothetical protein HETIRDRAFT_480729 [Heterobasidion irregulare TC 32-1]
MLDATPADPHVRCVVRRAPLLLGCPAHAVSRAACGAPAFRIHYTRPAWDDVRMVRHVDPHGTWRLTIHCRGTALIGALPGRADACSIQYMRGSSAA